jgi:hypothetical protein
VSELPCVGAGITVVDPGPSTDEVFRKQAEGRVLAPRSAPRKRKSSRASWHELPLRLLKAYVKEVIHIAANNPEHDGDLIVWTCGKREGHVYGSAQGHTWITGHGPQARGALLAARALEQQR